MHDIYEAERRKTDEIFYIRRAIIIFYDLHVYTESDLINSSCMREFE